MSRSTDERFIEDLRSITERRSPGGARLPAAPPEGPIPAGRGVGSAAVSETDPGGEGGGIDGPLVELDPALREYHPPSLITSSDGLVEYQIQPLAKVTFRDAGGRTVELFFGDPNA